MKYLLIFILCILSFNLKAGDSIPRFKISIGVGYPNVLKSYSYYAKIYSYGNFFKLYENQPGYKTKCIGPFYLKLEYRFKWWIGLGANVNYANAMATYIAINGAFDPNFGAVDNKVKIKYQSTTINFRSNFYFFNPKKRKTKSELYFGIGIGYNLWSFKVTSDYEEYTPRITFSEIYDYGLEASFGYRYNLNRHVALYSEIGVAKSIFQLGLTGSF